MNIAIFGAQGKFGKNLKERLEKFNNPLIQIKGTSDKNHNKQLAEWCDLAVLVVQPNQSNNLLREIAPLLKINAQVLSFCAGISIEELKNVTHRTVARGMADPLWQLGAFLFPEDFDENIKLALLSISKNTFLLNTDAEINRFTCLISYLFVVICSLKIGDVRFGFNRHIEFIKRQLNVDNSIIESISAKITNPTMVIESIMTKEGISSKVYKIITKENDIDPSSLLKLLEIQNIEKETCV